MKYIEANHNTVDYNSYLVVHAKGHLSAQSRD